MTATKIRPVQATAPERIYLQGGPQLPAETDFAALSEVTWCRDDVDGTGIPYVRADLAGAAPAAVAPQGEYPPLPKVAVWSVAGKDGMPTLGKGWMFSPVQQCNATLPLFTARQMWAYHDLGRQTSTAAPALEAPAAPAPAVPDGWRLVPIEFLRGFGTLAHNYSLTAIAPDHYWGNERSAFSDAYARCGQDLTKLRDMLSAEAPPLAAAPQAPAAPDDVLCYIRPGATLPERHGFEVCRATDAGAMAVMGDGRVAAAAEPASKRIGQILNPESEQSQATGAVVVAEIMSNGYNGQVLWKGKVPPVGTLLYTAPQAAPAAPAVDAGAEFPAMTDELASILGMMCFQCISFAQALRASGQTIKSRAEDEQAAVLYWMLGHYFRAGPEGWRAAAAADMERMREAAAQAAAKGAA